MSFEGHIAGEAQRELVTGYALGALSAAEAAELAVHLEECEGCRGYLAWLAPAIDVLPASVEQLRPSAGVRNAVMAEVNADAHAATVEAETRAYGSRPRRTGWRAWVLRPVTGFATTALVVAAIGGYLLHGSDTSSRSAVPAVASGTLPAGAASGTLDRIDGSGTLVVDKLPKLPRGRVYEAWIQRGSTRIPQGPFHLRPDGTQKVVLPDSLDGADAVLVTQEPQGGSDAPTGRAILRANLH